ncbi:MAG: helix-hairpin-helix domain-containing protein [Halodesulfurarchaeum sp.]
MSDYPATNLPTREEWRVQAQSDIPSPRTRELRQNHPGPNPVRVPKPFRSDSHGLLKWRYIKALKTHPEGIPLSRLVRMIDPVDATKSIPDREYTSRAYKFADRFLSRTKYAEVTRERPSPEHKSAIRTCYPTPEAFHLTPSKQISNSILKDRSKAYISTIPHVRQKSDAERISKFYLDYLDRIEDKRIMLEEQTGRGSDITMPYHTRFNNERRKRDQWQRYNTAWERASESYEKAFFWTLTSDPKRYESLSAMIDGLMDAWSQLLEALNQRFADSGRLDFIRALEFTGSQDSNFPGLPHLHVVVFGVPHMRHSWMSSYWSRHVDHAEIVHYHRITSRNGDWILHKDGSKITAQAYLGKYLSKSFETIGKTADEGYNQVESWDESDWVNSPIWKMALYWASGRQFWDSSHDLKESNPDTLQEVAGLGETKLERLAAHGIQTLADVRLADEDELAAIESISENMAQKLKEAAGSPSRFDVRQYKFVGAASPTSMPRYWANSAEHLGVSGVWSPDVERHPPPKSISPSL